MSMSDVEAIQAACADASAAASAALRLLLETKHLYQKVVVDISAAVAPVRNAGGYVLPRFERAIAKMIAPPQFVLPDPIAGFALSARGTHAITITPSQAKIFCDYCDAREAHVLVFSQELKMALHSPSKFSVDAWKDEDQYHLFWLAFKCQNCAAPPTNFMVRSKGAALFP